MIKYMYVIMRKRMGTLLWFKGLLSTKPFPFESLILSLRKSVPNVFFFATFFSQAYITFVYIYKSRAVGCIFGELLNNSPIFPVSPVKSKL